MQSIALNKIAADRNLPGGYPQFAHAAACLIDADGNVIFDGFNPGGFGPTTSYAKVSLAQMTALGAVSNGDVLAFRLPASAIVLSSTVKPVTALNGGKAKGTLTSDNTNITDGDTVTIDTKVYTFRDTLTPTEGEVLKGGSADASLLNLIRAINHSGTPGTDYSCAAAHPTVTAATSVTAHAFVVTAIVIGSAGNSVVTTEVSTHLSWGGATLASGGALVSAATARLISAQNNYGTAFDVAQATGAEVVDFDGTAKNELMGGPSTLNLHLTTTGATFDLLTAGEVEAWITWMLRIRR